MIKSSVLKFNEDNDSETQQHGFRTIKDYCDTVKTPTNQSFQKYCCIVHFNCDTVVVVCI